MFIFGIIKVIPPHQFESREIRRTINLKMVVPQSVTDRVLDDDGKILGYNLSFDEKKTMNYGTLWDLGKQIDSEHEDLTVAEHEDLFWQNIAQRSDSPLYSIDNEMSLFPRSHGNFWNLAMFTSRDSLIHQVCEFCVLNSSANLFSP